LRRVVSRFADRVVVIRWHDFHFTPTRPLFDPTEYVQPQLCLKDSNI
jgi:hypothetical protein